MKNNNLCNIGILIPAFNPDMKLLQLIDNLYQQSDFNQRIVVIDDGSDEQDIFNQIKINFSDIVVLHHEINEGKGAALKTGFKYIVENYPDILGIATMDADGQHLVEDLRGVEDTFIKNITALVIGSRTFGDDVPLRSRFGNLLTNKLVSLLVGINITDTQTGLRVIPIKYVKQLLSFKSNRYEFEFEMLLSAKQSNVELIEVPIQTVYLNDNETSHFRVIADSISIYSRFFKFAFSGLGSFLIDFVSFYILVNFMMNATSSNFILLATIIARLLSAIFNYGVNKKIVFQDQGSWTLLKYVTLMFVQMIASGLMTTLMSELTGQLNSTFWITFIKLWIDFLLFLISYQIQKKVVFKPTEGKSEA